MKKKKATLVLIVSIIIILTSAAVCGKSTAQLATIHNLEVAPSIGGGNGLINILPETGLSAQSLEMSPVSLGKGDETAKNHVAEIDVSNTKDGYIMVRYLKKTNKALRVIVKGPGGISYVYALRADGEYDVFPLSNGNGIYYITVYENVIDNKYIPALEITQYVQLTDEFAPFIHPNQYVNYTDGSQAIKKAAELTKDSKSEAEKIAAIYNFVIRNLDYDHQLADTVQPGYRTDLDAVLKNGKGICIDYASLMIAMLRSQGIPAKLVVGYAGKTYHSWVSVYSREGGWVGEVIYLERNRWKLMDPTLASGYNNSSEILKYINDEKNYSAKYFY